MANKRFWFGMLVIVLVFGMTAVGCDSEKKEETLYLEINNLTDDPITEVVFSDRPNRGGIFLMQDNSGIPAHSKKSYDPMNFGYYISLMVQGEVVPFTDRSGTPIMFYKGSGTNAWQFYLEKKSGVYEFMR
jgi:hypothetical protein